MGNIISNICGEVPSIGKIQATMTDVIERFKAKGYVPSKSVLERTPDADEFVSKTVGERNLVTELVEHTYNVSDAPVQKLYSYKPYKSAENYATQMEELNSRGQCVRSICDDGIEHFGGRSIREYEYDGDTLTRVNEYIDAGDMLAHTRKVIDPKTGDYTQEFVRNSDYRSITHYDKNHRKLKETTINKFNGIETTTHKLYDPETRKVIGLEQEEINSYHFKTPKKFVSKCEINPETGKVSKYVELKADSDEVYMMFERDIDGTVTHYIDRLGNEYKLNPTTGEAVLTYKNGGRVTGSAAKFIASDFWEDMTKHCSGKIFKDYV